MTQIDGTSEQIGKDASTTRSLDRQRAADEAARDAALMARVGARDQQALAELYERHAGAVYSIALAILHDPGRAEDVTQEAFLTLWNQPERYNPAIGRFAPWCYRIARNRAIDVIRQRRREVMPDVPGVFDLMLGAAADNPAEEVVGRDEARRVRAALGRLPAEQRLVLELAYFGGLSQSQMAARLGIPLGTIKTRVRTALFRLREMLESDPPPS